MSNSMPCPLCSTPLDIRKSVKGKPYTVCDRCGMQMFIRKDTGISALKRLITSGATDAKQQNEKLGEKLHQLERELQQKTANLESAEQTKEALSRTTRQLQEARSELAQERKETAHLEKRIAEVEKALLRTCPGCGEQFRISEDLIKTSWFDGRFAGYRCPCNGCEGVVPPLKEN